MRVFIAGGSGAVGRPLARLLSARGHDVVATTRNGAKAEAIRATGATPAVMDGLDAGSVRRAVTSARPDVVVHQMTALSSLRSFRKLDEEFAVTNRLRTEGTRYLLEAARAAGARRFVAQSYSGWPNARTGGRVKTEDDPLDSDPPRASRQTIGAIKDLEATVASAGGIVLRYGSFYGPGTSLGPDGELTQLVRKRRFPLVGDGAGVWSFLHVDDAASATVAAVEGTASGIFNVVDDEPAEVSVWLPALAQAVGAKPPRHVPEWLGRLFLGEVGTAMMTEARGSSNARAHRVLGWEPAFPTWRKGFATLT